VELTPQRGQFARLPENLVRERHGYRAATAAGWRGGTVMIAFPRSGIAPAGATRPA
jgi:hypothetical protein